LGGTPWHRASAFWLHAVAIPEPRIEVKPPPASDTRYLSVQRVGIMRQRLSGYLALTLWMVMLGIGVWRAYGAARPQRLEVLLGLGVVGQFLVTFWFGSESILYSPYYVPLLLFIASRAFGDQRRATLYALGLALLGLLLWNNVQMFLYSRSLSLSLIGPGR
jgi:hypothetical protein